MYTDSVASRMRLLGRDEIARRYFLWSESDSEHHPDFWAWSAVWGGEDLDGSDLPTELWFELILAALAVCPDDALWGMGDSCFDTSPSDRREG